MGNSLTVSVVDNSSSFNGWKYKSYFQSAPGTSDQATAAGGSADELHIVVVDELGKFTGVPGQVLETFGYLSKASNAVLNGATNYYKQVLFNSSRYVYAADPVDYSNTSDTWGSTIDTTFATVTGNTTLTLAGGADDAPSDGDLTDGYDMFANKDSIDISLIITGGASTTVQNHVITGVAATRADCLAFVSPRQTDVVNNPGNESTDVLDWIDEIGRAHV